jgi:phosphate-selective porin OprO and OprP
VCKADEFETFILMDKQQSLAQYFLIMKILLKFFFLVFPMLPLASRAQQLGPEQMKLYFDEGVIFKDDNNFFMRMRFRLQNRYTLETQEAQELDLAVSEFRIRRTRLRFDGYALDPRLLYRLQLSFTRDDMDWDNSQVPNVLRDAVAGWRWTPYQTTWVGMTKLPGNRQRVVSSGSLQLVDRSIVNAIFTIDRDTGIQHHSQFGSERPLWLKFALSNGEGRNKPNRNASMASTVRMEWQPLGTFKGDGDNFEADLNREAEPRLALALVHSANQSSSRTGGQIGRDLPSDTFRSMESRMADALFKYRGFSLSSEWAKRTAPSPIISADRFIYVGEGLNIQGGYVFDSNWEPSFRLSMVRPEADIRDLAQEQLQYTLGLSKYIRRHAIKVQSDLTYQEQLASPALSYNANWALRLQVEVGI